MSAKKCNYYCVNFITISVIVASICLMFYIQFRFDNLSEKVAAADHKIYLLEDEIRTVEVEWTYLTRPERLRVLAERYLGNGYASSYQIKSKEKMAQYYAANYIKQQNSLSQLALNESSMNSATR